MTERETLTTEIKAAVSRLQPHEVEALAAHLERAGFRKTLDVSELERYERDWSEASQHTVMNLSEHGAWVKYSDLRRLAAPKERVLVGFLFKDREGGYLCHVTEKDLTSFRNSVSWVEVGPVFMDPPPPTNPAQTAKEAKPCPNCKETVQPCACERNRCNLCGGPVGNITFSRCDDCWDDAPTPEQREGS